MATEGDGIRALVAGGGGPPPAELNMQARAAWSLVDGHCVLLLLPYHYQTGTPGQDVAQ